MPMIFAEKDKPLLIHEYNDTYVGEGGNVGMCMHGKFLFLAYRHRWLRKQNVLRVLYLLHKKRE